MTHRPVLGVELPELELSYSGHYEIATPRRPHIDLRCCDTAAMLADARGAELVVADAPWGEYAQRPGVAAPDLSFPVLELAEIAEHLALSYASTAPGARLVSWWLWPHILEALRDMARHGDRSRWAAVIAPGRWRAVSGGSWHKAGRAPGVGYHWLGHSEPVLVYRRPGRMYLNRREQLRNAHTTQRRAHSEKPVDWMRAWIRRWTPPGGLVVDLYAGTGAVAVACALEGRAYIGAEIDPTRHAIALQRVAAVAAHR